jgi:hypothetical protein
MSLIWTVRGTTLPDSKSFRVTVGACCMIGVTTGTGAGGGAITGGVGFTMTVGCTTGSGVGATGLTCASRGAPARVAAINKVNVSFNECLLKGEFLGHVCYSGIEIYQYAQGVLRNPCYNILFTLPNISTSILPLQSHDVQFYSNPQKYR